MREEPGYQFPDPCPPAMRGVSIASYNTFHILFSFLSKIKISDLSSVSIEWKMLTALRPENQLDEDIFTRYSGLNGSLHTQAVG